MKELHWTIVIISVILILFTGYVVYIINLPFGPGTQFVFKVKGDGCSKINENKQNRYDLSFNLTDELMDNVIVEYGYPATGLKNGTLREFCQRYKDIKNCERNIAEYCMREMR
ncbi:MAG: hypothetical protein J7K87_04440 [Candidatus Aenigmarchaeota archaeon]|nr:hypothetical protein [Candidatus Aenigmarchaeota archaeon]RLF42218.1 MAG: hypothetical protein DRN17_08020 [Thermoplasmata archaeon]